MSELFEVPKTLSPRLAWMRENGVKTWRCAIASPQWMAWLPSNDHKGIPHNPEACGYGDTEEQAVEDLALLCGDHWNKESPWWADPKPKEATA